MQSFSDHTARMASMYNTMDFIQALRKAEAAGISEQQFLKIWDYETMMKKMEPQLMKTKNSDEVTSEASLIEAQLKKFSLNQRQVLTNLREELQQQNQALMADISRLLEGFASLVGRVIKGELQTTLEGLNLSTGGNRSSIGAHTSSQTAHTTESSNAGSTRTWSKVHVEQSSSSSDGGEYNGNQVMVEDLIQQVGQSLITKKKTRKRGKAKKTQMVDQEQNTKLDPSKKQIKKNKLNPEKPLVSSLVKDLKEGNGKSPSVCFFPEDGSANMVVFGIRKVAKSGKISKSPVYFIQDCPFKVQLSIWFELNELKMCLTFWGLSENQIEVSRIFTISGEIQNQGSSAYSTLFTHSSPPLNLQKPLSQNVYLPLALKTMSGSYSDVKLKMLEKRGYILNNSSISLRWKVVAE